MVRPGQRQAHADVGGAWQPYSDGYDEQGVVNEGGGGNHQQQDAGVNPEVYKRCWSKRKKDRKRALTELDKGYFLNKEETERVSSAKNDKKAF